MKGPVYVLRTAGPVFIDRRPRSQPFILKGENSAEAARQAGLALTAAAAASISAGTLAIFNNSLSVRNLGTTLLEVGTDDYGMEIWSLRNDGVFEMPTLIAARGEFSVLSAPFQTTVVLSTDEYVETWQDAYGVVTAAIDRNGKFVGDQFTSLDALLPQEIADIERLEQKPDGVTRIAQWTYIPVYGESTSVGSQGNPAITLTQPYSNLTFVGGVKASVGAGTASAIALVEDNLVAGGGAADGIHGETTCSGMANTISEYLLSRYGVNPATTQIFTSAPGQGGQRIDQLHKGTTYYTRLMGHVTAAKSLATAAGKTFICPVVTFICGANDAFAGTARATVASRLVQLAIDLDTDIRAITGQSLPVRMLMYQVSGAGAAANTEAVQLGILDADAASDLIQFMGPWYDLDYTDGVHCPNTAYKYAGRRHGIAVGRYLMEGRTRGLLGVAAWSRGQTVRVRYTENIEIDTTSLGQATNYGVSVVDTVGTVPLSSITTDRGDLVLALGRPLSGAWNVRVALDYKGAGLTVAQGSNGRSSNIRGVLTHSYYASGVQKTIYRWAPSQQLAGQTLEF